MGHRRAEGRSCGRCAVTHCLRRECLCMCAAVFVLALPCAWFEGVCLPSRLRSRKGTYFGFLQCVCVCFDWCCFASTRQGPLARDPTKTCPDAVFMKGSGVRCVARTAPAAASLSGWRGCRMRSSETLEPASASTSTAPSTRWRRARRPSSRGASIVGWTHRASGSSCRGDSCATSATIGSMPTPALRSRPPARLRRRGQHRGAGRRAHTHTERVPYMKCHARARHVWEHKACKAIARVESASIRHHLHVKVVSEA